MRIFLHLTNPLIPTKECILKVLITMFISKIPVEEKKYKSTFIPQREGHIRKG